MPLTYTRPTEGCHQFRVPTWDDETIALLVNHEGIIIDIEDSNGEVIRTAYQFWNDLAELTNRKD